MGLDGLLGVVFLKGHKILHGELAARGVEVDRHRLPEHRQPFAQRDRLLLVQPQKCAIH
jgi:hypothetical protein